MIRTLFFVDLVAALYSACSSDSANSDGGAGTGNTSCPDLSGEWTIASHCEMSLIDMTVPVTQNGCKLSFAAPFDGFTGSVAENGAITVSGPQSCQGAATKDAILMLCTQDSPDECLVELKR